MNDLDSPVPPVNPDLDCQLGKRLPPISAGVIRQALDIYRANDPDFVGAYFPNVASRGRASYDDVFSMDRRQAESLLPMIDNTVRYFRKLDAKEKNRNIHLVERTPIDPDFESQFEKRVKLWTTTLRDLCSVFGIESPL
jgi:hypothetical protein